MKKLDIKLGLTTLVIAIIYYFLTSQMPAKAAFYPKFVALLLAGLSMVFIIKTTFSSYESKDSPFKNMQIKQFFFVLSTAFVYISLIKILGYFTSTFIFILICLVGLNAKKSKSILTAIGFSLFILITFKILLSVPLPKGFIF